MRSSYLHAGTIPVSLSLHISLPDKLLPMQMEQPGKFSLHKTFKHF